MRKWQKLFLTNNCLWISAYKRHVWETANICLWMEQLISVRDELKRWAAQYLQEFCKSLWWILAILLLNISVHMLETLSLFSINNLFPVSVYEFQVSLSSFLSFWSRCLPQPGQKSIYQLNLTLIGTIWKFTMYIFK